MGAVDPAAAQAFLQTAIPMYGRMIHKQTGELDSQLYDRDGQVSIGFRAVHLYRLHSLHICFFSVYQFDR
jgi:hypothetical protein